jgi:gluconokinase
MTPVAVDPETLALGIDLGTGSARAYVLDGAGRRLGGVRYPYSWTTATDGTMEAAADPVVDLLFSAVDAAVESLPAGAVVQAVGVSALWHTLLALDASDRPLTPVYAWSDTRSTRAAAALRRELDMTAVHARTGAMLHPSYPPARLRWLRETAPAIFARARRWLSLPEYLWLRLTGDHAVDLSIAAGSGLLDQASMDWDEELLQACGVSHEQLGRVVVGHEAASLRESRGAAAERWPALRDAVWRMPVGDGACANIGSGCRDRARAALSIGTSAAIRVITTGGWVPPPPGLWCYRMDHDRTVMGGAVSNGGLVRSWLEATLRLPAAGAELDAMLDARQPATHGITTLPFLAGERSPDWPLDAVATLSGVRAAHSALDLLQAGMEAVVYRLALLLDRLRQSIPEARTIVASGGALRASPAWGRLLADALGEAVLLAADPEASSRGAALLALEAAGLTPSADLAPLPTTRIDPDPERHRLHALAITRHTALEERLR